MAKDKYISTEFKLSKIPENYQWEVHSLHAYAELKEKVAKGEKTIDDLRAFEYQHREKPEQREMRWRREYIMRELAQKNAEGYRDFKENPKAFLRKMLDMGKRVSQWWWRKPKSAAGKGRMVQNPITGAWSQEYRPNKSMKMKEWLEAANRGNVMKHMNPKGIPLNREPTDEEKGISDENKKKRAKKVWDWLLNETNNFGRGFDDPKWGKVYKGRPGRGGGGYKPGKYTIK